jgi:hypothetical protein
MSYLFSAGTNGFYLAGVNIDIPSDAVEITDDVYFSLFAGQNSGKLISSDSSGNPVLIEQSPPTTDQLISIANSQKSFLISEATIAISPLQDAVDLGEATDSEVASLKLWKQYRISVNRTDTSTAPNISWPVKPT